MNKLIIFKSITQDTFITSLPLSRKLSNLKQSSKITFKFKNKNRKKQCDQNFENNFFFLKCFTFTLLFGMKAKFYDQLIANIYVF